MVARKDDRRRLAILLGPVTLFLGVFFLGPLLVMIVYSFLAPGLYGGVEWQFYHWNYGRILGWADGEWEDFDPVYIADLSALGKAGVHQCSDHARHLLSGGALGQSP